MRRNLLGVLGVASYLGVAVLLAGCATSQQSSETHASAVRQGPSAPAAHAAPAHGAAAEPRVSAQDALDRLQAGNQRFANNRAEHSDCSPLRRSEVAKGQHPFAIVLTCADSRVPPEILFDCGLGDIFVIRVAGNTADDAAIGSMEYAVEHLHVPLIVVLGHERCGAVQAAVQAAEKHETAPGHLGAILNPIEPAVTAVKGLGGDAVENAVCENVMRVVHQLRTSKPILAEAVHERKVSIIGARYDLDSGLVTRLEQAKATR